MKQTMKHVETENDQVVYCLQNETGIARMMRSTVFPGIDILRVESHLQELAFHVPPRQGVFSITHCEDGRIECNFRNDETLYMGKGDMSIGWREEKEYCHRAFFPTAYYKGSTILIDVAVAQPVLDKIFDEEKIDLTKLCNKFCCRSDFGIILGVNPEIKSLFQNLYHVSEKIAKRYYRLKILEILLFLSAVEDVTCTCPQSFPKSQIETIKSVQTDMTQCCNKKITIGQLAEKYQISQTTLKKCFKEVYGKSVYQYLKDFRISEAERLLITTEDTVLEIANQVGYENCSKFAEAFRKKTGMLPKDYRKHNYN